MLNIVQDEHIMARRFADKWLYKALGSGLHGRVIHRSEKGDPRKKLINAVRLITLQRGQPEKVSLQYNLFWQEIQTIGFIAIDGWIHNPLTDLVYETFCETLDD